MNDSDSQGSSPQGSGSPPASFGSPSAQPPQPVPPIYFGSPPPPKKRRLWPWVLFGLPVLFCGGSVLLVALAGNGGGASVPSKAVLKMTLSGPMPERAPEDDFATMLGKGPVTVKEHLDNLKKAAKDKRIKGVVLKLESPMIGWAKVEELAAGIEEFRKSGKFVYAYSEFLNEHDYRLALAADEVFMPPDAFFEFNGFAAEVLHYPGLLEKLGIEVQFFRYGKYKSVSGETFGRKALTEPVKEMITETLTTETELFVDAVARGRKLDAAKVRELLENPGLRAEWAKEHKLIDGILYADELEQKAKEKMGLGEKDKLEVVSAQKYRRVSWSDAGAPEGKHKMALITSQGLIVAGKGGVDPFSGDDAQGSTPIIEAMRKAVEDEKVKAIIFRVDSPGGAGLGCDLVRREVERLREKKPIIVSMGDAAASGGYWVSMDATAIVAQPSTMTGSIGIWSVIPNLKGTYEKLGLNQEIIKLQPHADALQGSRPMSEEEAKVFDDNLKASYDRFVALAAKGRKKELAAMEEAAQGRTWLGKSALERGLVDRLGGFDAAVALAKEHAKLGADETVKLESFDAPKGFLAQLLGDDDESDDDDLSSQALAKVFAASGLNELMPQSAKTVLSVSRAIVQRREHVFPLSEVQLEIR